MKNIKMLLLVIVVFIGFLGIGYAQKVDGYVNNSNQDFKVEFESAMISDYEGTNADNIYARVSKDNRALFVSAGDLMYPGAFVSYDVTIKNSGIYDAKIESIEVLGKENAKAIKVKGLEKYNGEVLKSGEESTVNFSIIWDESYNEADESVNFEIRINYMQDI